MKLTIQMPSSTFGVPNEASINCSNFDMVVGRSKTSPCVALVKVRSVDALRARSRF